MTLRIGLVGTGFWARNYHSVALHRSRAVEFAGVWGRNRESAQDLAHQRGVPAYAEVDDLFDDVQAVEFAVPPNVQASLALQAAERGKHLLLEKPIAFGYHAARTLADVVAAKCLASLVFFTSRFRPEIHNWVHESASADWTSAAGNWICSAFGAESPYLPSKWRWEKGGLWDVGPHALSLILPLMGEVDDVTGVQGPGDLVHLIMRHANRATTTLTLTLRAPEHAAHIDLRLWGERGTRSLPTPTTNALDALDNALGTLADMVKSGTTTHPCDVRFGASVVQILERAERRLSRTPDPLGAGQPPLLLDQGSSPPKAAR